MQVDEIVLASRVCNLFGGIPQAWQRTARPSAHAVQHATRGIQHNTMCPPESKIPARSPRPLRPFNFPHFQPQVWNPHHTAPHPLTPYISIRLMHAWGCVQWAGLGCAWVGGA
jgi:hypothetical protein